MILTSTEPVGFVPEVNSKKFYSYTCFCDVWMYKNGIDGSAVVRYIKRKQQCQE